LVQLEQDVEDIDILCEFCAFLVREVNFGFIYKTFSFFIVHEKLYGLTKASVFMILREV
jgi:hypothetical protein